MDTSHLPGADVEYLSDNRSELGEFVEALIGYDTQNPPGRTVHVAEWIDPTLEESALTVDRVYC
jgi:succinyl-diaminopimelate desuccinylase